MKLESTKEAGIYLYKGKKDSIYYGSFRCPNTKNVIRKRIGTKTEIGTPKKALFKLEKIIEDMRITTEKIVIEHEYENYLSLNQLAKTYFDDRIERKRNDLRKQFNYLDESDFENYTVVIQKLNNIEKHRKFYIKNISKTDIANKHVNKITKADVKHFEKNILPNLKAYQRVKKAAKPIVKALSEKSQFNLVSQIKTIFNYAIKEETINIDNPFNTLKPKNPQKQRERVLSEQEIRNLLNECKMYMKTQPSIYLSVYLAVLTAGRSSTIRSIKAKDIDTENKTISLYNFKASRQYKLRITDKANEWLKTKVLPYYEPNEFILRANDPQRRSNPPKPIIEIPKSVYRIMDIMFNNHLDKTNNQDRDKVVNFHTIRRSIATNLAKSGVSLYDVMVLLNHSNIEQTMKYLNMEHNNLHAGVNNLMNNIFNDF